MEVASLLNLVVQYRIGAKALMGECIKEIYFVTTNMGKLREANHFLGFGLRHARIEIGEIQSVSAAEIVRDKALKAYGKLGKPVIVDDTGLYVRCLRGFPGALVRWLLDAVGNEGICRLVDNYDDRTAYAETVIGFCDGRETRSFSARCHGAISGRPLGKLGFGWDRIFIPRGSELTLAEMTLDEKGTFAMRRMALLKLKSYLKKRGYL